MSVNAHIEVKTGKYRYLWLKYVTGFDIREHCARCLIGKYSKMIKFRSQGPGAVFEGELNEHEAPYLYLCGVTGKWANNLHIAFQYCAWDKVEYEDDNIKVVLDHASRLPIEPVKGLSLPSAYTTCRNFQFGYHYFHEVLVT